eukprot:s1341_g2.t1
MFTKALLQFEQHTMVLNGPEISAVGVLRSPAVFPLWLAAWGGMVCLMSLLDSSRGTVDCPGAALVFQTAKQALHMGHTLMGAYENEIAMSCVKLWILRWSVNFWPPSSMTSNVSWMSVLTQSPLHHADRCWRLPVGTYVDFVSEDHRAPFPVGSCIDHVCRVSFFPPASGAEAGLLLVGCASVGVSTLAVSVMMCFQFLFQQASLLLTTPSPLSCAPEFACDAWVPAVLLATVDSHFVFIQLLLGKIPFNR